MTKFNHILKEVFRNIFKNPGTSFSNILVLSLLFILFDLFWIAAGTSDQFYKSYLSELQMEAYLSETTPDSLTTTIEENIKTLEGVSQVKYISKDLAKDILNNMVGVDLLVGYDSINPLPRSYIISFEAGFTTSDNLEQLAGQVDSLDGISHSYYSKTWLSKAETTKQIISDVGYVLGLLILITVLMSSANNMRLTAKARATGFYQMRLQGAGKMLLGLPFVFEGFIFGAFSAFVGWGVIMYLKNKIEFSYFTLVFPSWQEILIYCLAAGVIGMLSGYFGINRQLKL